MIDLILNSRTFTDEYDQSKVFILRNWKGWTNWTLKEAVGETFTKVLTTPIERTKEQLVGYKNYAWQYCGGDLTHNKTSKFNDDCFVLHKSCAATSSKYCKIGDNPLKHGGADAIVNDYFKRLWYLMLQIQYLDR